MRSQCKATHSILFITKLIKAVSLLISRWNQLQLPQACEERKSTAFTPIGFLNYIWTSPFRATSLVILSLKRSRSNDVWIAIKDMKEATWSSGKVALVEIRRTLVQVALWPLDGREVFHDRPNFNSSAMRVDSEWSRDSQLVCFLPVDIFELVVLNLYYFVY